jgi:hypothetical protein
VLAQTTSCDLGVQYDLTCDACGAHFDAEPPVRRDPAQLWAAAGADRWVLLAGRDGFGHRCATCAAGVLRSPAYSH